MNILFCYPSFFPITGGGTVHGYYLAKNLYEQGHKITVINKQDDGFTNYINKKDILKFIKAVRCSDVVYVRISTSGVANFIPFIANLLGAKVIGEVNAPSEELYLLGKSKRKVLLSRFLLKFQLKFCSELISVSEEVNNYLLSLDLSSHVIYNGGERIKELPSEAVISKSWTLKYKKIMLWSGNVYSWQGSNILKDITDRANQLGYGVIIVTNENYNSNFSSNVKIIVNPTREQLSNIYQLCDIGLAPYDLSTLTKWGFYNSPLKIYEYLANDLLVFTNAKNAQIDKLANVIFF
ncbi:hypothetical protein [Photobacterium kishitanii]|nr:hypothetical protein [Photobacterium kishitanii]OBU24038.1 hypothetical protein AYY23_11500 [Photobacterium kishitanii]